MSVQSRVHLQVESLEERAVPASALVTDGVLTITGTRQADKIVVQQKRGRISIEDTRIKVNGVATASVSARSVRRIRILGLQGDDVIRLNKGRGAQPITVPAYVNGGAGKDKVQGGWGDDVLYGSLGADVLVGGPGNDSLFGGDAARVDRLTGGVGADRFLRQNGDAALDLGSDDASILFRDRSSVWTEKEIAVVDAAFTQLVQATGNTRLLRDTASDLELKFDKESPAAFPGALGSNAGQGALGRTIRIIDFDESSDVRAIRAMDTVIHEIAHNWDSETERTRVGLPGGTWSGFTALSNWQSREPRGDTHDPSGDGRWWHRKVSTSAFFGSLNRTVRGTFAKYGMKNPLEDWTTTFQYYFREMRGSGPFGGTLDPIAHAKLMAVEQLLRSLVTPSTTNPRAASDHLAEVLRLPS